MDIKEARKALEALQLREFAYGHAMGLLYYDGATIAPRDTYIPRGKTMSVLGEEAYKLSTGEEAMRLLDYLAEHTDELTPAERRITELKRKEMREMRCIPMEEYVAYSELLNESAVVWRDAKQNSDYDLFEPYLARIIETERRFAGLISPEKDAYDYCLDKFEEGLTQKKCEEFFAALRVRLVPLLGKAVAAKQPETEFMRAYFPESAQAELSKKLMELMGIDKNRCCLATTEHPFTTGFSKYDIRITTKYDARDFASSMYSVIHEGGHALYELHTADEYAYTALGSGVSMAVHESQSRFYENILGRSRAFVEKIYPEIVSLCPAFSAHTAEEMYRAVNRAEPSLIRTEADEMTYYLHVMVRFEAERAFMSGDASAKELPQLWNSLYKKYLGIEVPDAKRGVLQDSHWSNGQIGYFPSYAIGSAYGAQLAEKMKLDVDMDGCIAAGDFKPINGWLEERIWKYGCLYKPSELIENALGEPFDPKYYADYLEAKARDVYGV